ncbi:MAG: TauD/TfdA family dioxygenase [Novosphingobium sp.]
MPVETQPKLEQITISPHIGSELRVAKADLLSGELGPEIRGLLEQRGVILFRAIDLSDEEQIEFTKTLGTMAQDIYKISMDPLENPNFAYTKGAFYWHIDGTMSDVPIFASVMSCRRKSPVGGKTEFCNTYAAYDALPEDEKRQLEGIKAVHQFESAQRYVNPEPSYKELRGWQKFEPNVLPLVWTHRNGRKSLVLGATASHVEGMELREGQLLLARLRDWATQEQFTYSHEWTVGDMIMWDNTGTMHRVMAYPEDSGRLMHRTTVQGDEPFA